MRRVATCAVCPGHRALPQAPRVRTAIQGGELTLPADIAALAGQTETLMGTAAPPLFHLITPVAMGVVQDRPVLAWEPLAGADHYVIAIADEEGRPVVRGLEVRGPAVTLPEPLPRGRVYSWQVTAHRGADAITEPHPPQPATGSSRRRLQRWEVGGYLQMDGSTDSPPVARTLSLVGSMPTTSTSRIWMLS